MFPIKSLTQLSKLEVALVALVVLLAGALVVLTGYLLWVDAAAPSQSAVLPPKSRIIFVTATPQSQTQIKLQKTPAIAQNSSLATPTPGAYFAGANELGKVMVLEYHRVASPETRYQRSPDNFRKDIQRLIDHNYYPVNFIDLVNGLKDVPAGKKPIVITFDDSDMSQFYVLDDRTVDADCGLGILLNFHAAYKNDWPLRATFFVLGDDSNNYNKIFGQSEWAQQKLQVLAELGMEIGSHTVSHVDLSQVTAERIEWELAVSQHVIKSLVPGYKVQSLSVPYGGFPWTYDFLKAGNWGDYTYTYAANVAAWGGPSPSPYSPEFDAYHVSRIEITDVWADHWFSYFEQNPQEYYTSDGDPNRLTYPKPEQLQIAAENSAK